MDGGKKVWVPHPVDGFKMGRIVDIGGDTISVELFETPGQISTAPYARVFPAEEYDKKDCDDNCALMYLNEATLLNNLRLRYARNAIYTYVANILIAINPYFDLPQLYSKDTINSYKGKSLGTMPPHVYAIADKAYRDMKFLKQSQSIVVSGESGAGKTESTKYILKYLTECWGTHAGPIEDRIVESNPLLEAFGNAKTVRNNNSSRFGKFIEIHFDEKYQVCGGFISHYLLEKSRICMQSADERNYHIFYRLCAGAPDALRQKLGLLPPDQFHYLKRGNTQYFVSKANAGRIPESQKSKQFLKNGSLHDITLDDLKDFQLTDKAMTAMGLPDSEKLAIYMTVAGVLHLGNVTFEESAEDTKGGCQVSKGSIGSLKLAAQLLGCEEDQLRESLITRIMQAAGSKGSLIKVPLKVVEAQNARDALAKAVYARLFDLIVTKVNQALPFQSSKNYMGILDIAGFEYFQTNSFEQFCINYCNEKLQQFFNERILKEEQALYEKEDLKVKKISYVDNQDCIDLIEGKNSGIFDLLDEESKLPKPSYDHFTQAVQLRNKDHYRLSVPRKSQLKIYREVRDDEGFLIRHYAGAVVYDTTNFIEKNNDALHDSLEALMLESNSEFIKKIFEPNANTETALVRQKGKLAFISVGNKFRSQLTSLMDKLRSTGTNFIRCIKPNSKMVDHMFEGSLILAQLQCSGMTSVLDLMQQGFPSRTQFAELYAMYKALMPAEIARLDPRLFCKALFKALGLNENDYKFGMTKVFFRPGKFAEFDKLLTADPAQLAELIKKVKTWLMRMRWRKCIWGALCVIKLKNKILYRKRLMVNIQKTIRTWTVMKEYRPRIRGLVKVRTLYVQLEPMRQMAELLNESKAVALSQVTTLETQMEAIITRIQTTNVKETEINRICETMSREIEKVLSELKRLMEKEQVAIEQERQRKLREEEEERQRKLKAEEEERQRKIEAEEAEKRRLQEIEMEKLRKAQAEERERLRKIQLEEEERQRRIQAEEEERLRKIQAEEEERRRIQAEEMERIRKAQAEEEERLRKLRLEEEELQRRIQAEEEERQRKMKAEEEERRKIQAEEAERIRKAQAEERERQLKVQIAEEERQRRIRAEEEERQHRIKAEEEERRRIQAEEAERIRKAHIEEQERLRKMRLEEEDRLLRIRAEEEERQRKVKAEEEEQRRIFAAELERLRAAQAEELERLRQIQLEEEERQRRIQAEEQERLHKAQLEEEERQRKALAEEMERLRKIQAEELERQRKAQAEEEERQRKALAEEMERLRKIQEQIELERKKKEEEDRIRRQEEEERRVKAEMEAARRREEEEQKRLAEVQRKFEEELRAKRAKEEEEERLRLRNEEQARLDRELAMRLAFENQSLLEDMSDPSRYDYSLKPRQGTQRADGQRILPMPNQGWSMGSPQTQHHARLAAPPAGGMRQSASMTFGQPIAPAAQPQPVRPTGAQSKGDLTTFDPLADIRNQAVKNGGVNGSGKKYDLTKWKYTDLRDAINTTTDVELIEACREEFYRRLRLYQEWKAKNTKQGGPDADSRIPAALAEEAARIQATLAALEAQRGQAHNQSPLPQNNQPPQPQNNQQNAQRFFRIPYTRPGDQLRDPSQPKGWWLAHFDGKFIARQLELHPNQPPVLYVAGVDDMKMCELGLEQTGLTRRQGAEISEQAFETVWTNNGGMAILQKAKNQLTSNYLRQRLG